jgi:plastocyanin
MTLPSKRVAVIHGRAALFTAAMLFLTVSCSSNNNKPSAPTRAPSASAPTTASAANATAAPGGATTAATIQNLAFPASIAIKSGTSVTWANKDGFPHTVASDPGQAASFDSKPIDAGATFSVTFAKAGTYAYHCNIHPSMHGAVVVSD